MGKHTGFQTPWLGDPERPAQKEALAVWQEVQPRGASDPEASETPRPAESCTSKKGSLWAAPRRLACGCRPRVPCPCTCTQCPGREGEPAGGPCRGGPGRQAAPAPHRTCLRCGLPRCRMNRQRCRRCPLPRLLWSARARRAAAAARRAPRTQAARIPRRSGPRGWRNCRSR